MPARSRSLHAPGRPAPRYSIVAELPGVKPEDVNSTVEGNLLTIKGTKEQVAADLLGSWPAIGRTSTGAARCRDTEIRWREEYSGHGRRPIGNDPGGSDGSEQMSSGPPGRH